MLAAIWSRPQATFASGVTIDGDTARVVREVDAGLETIEIDLPADTRAYKLNPDQSGFYHVHYADAGNLSRLAAMVAGKALSDSRCAAAAAAFYPEVGTVIDVGAEGFRVHKLNAHGKLIKSLANDTSID